MLYARRGFPFSDDKLCQLAYDLACQTNRKGFSPVKKKAGRAWLSGYMDRHPRLRKKMRRTFQQLEQWGQPSTDRQIF